MEERVRQLSGYRKLLLLIQVAALLIFTVVYLFAGKLLVNGGLSHIYVVGAGAGILGAVSVLCQQEVFDKKRKSGEEESKLSTPGVGAKYAPTLTQTAFTVISVLCFVAGLTV